MTARLLLVIFCTVFPIGVSGQGTPPSGNGGADNRPAVKEAPKSPVCAGYCCVIDGEFVCEQAPGFTPGQDPPPPVATIDDDPLGLYGRDRLIDNFYDYRGVDG